MQFQLEVGQYPNEANKNRYTNFQRKASIKDNLKIAEDQIVQGIVLGTRNCHILLLGLESNLLLGLVVLESIFFKCKLCLFEQGISRFVFISIQYT